MQTPFKIGHTRDYTLCSEDYLVERPIPNFQQSTIQLPTFYVAWDFALIQVQTQPGQILQLQVPVGVDIR